MDRFWVQVEVQASAVDAASLVECVVDALSGLPHAAVTVRDLGQVTHAHT